MSGKKKAILLITVFVGIFVIGFFAGKFMAWLEGPDKSVIYEAQINGALKTAEKYGLEYVYLKDLTGFDWEKVCVITPYSTGEKVKQQIGVKYVSAALDDSEWELLFIDKNKNLIPIEVNEYKTVGFGFDIEGAVHCAEKNNAKLVFYIDKKWKAKVAALVQQ